MAYTKDQQALLDRWKKHANIALRQKTRDGWVMPSKAEQDYLFDMALDYGLDPLKKEICLVFGNIYFTVGGLYRIANRDDILNGVETTDAQYVNPIDPEVETSRRWIITVRMWKKGAEHPFEGVVDELEYRNSKSDIWQKCPRRMTTKCGEALVLRMMLNVGIPTIEEMGYDEATGTTAEEAIVETRAVEQVEKATDNAEAAKEKKEAATTEKKEAKAEKSTKTQLEMIGSLYKRMGLKRAGDDGSEALFKKQFPELDREQYLTKDPADTYIRFLYGRLLAFTIKQSGLPKELIEKTIGDTIKDTKNLTPEEADACILALKHHVIDQFYTKLGWSEDERTKHWGVHSPDIASVSDASVDQLEGYIAELEAALEESQKSPATDGKPTDGAGQGSLVE